MIITSSLLFLIMMGVGGVISILFSVDTKLAQRMRPFGTICIDIVFSIISLLIVFFALEKACKGDLRLYQFAGLFIGFFVVRLFITRLLIRE